MHLNMSLAKCQTFCFGLVVLIDPHVTGSPNNLQRIFSMDKLAVPLFWCTAKEAVKLRENRQRINSLWPSDTIWRHKYRSTLAQVMAWCLTAPSHYLLIDPHVTGSPNDLQRIFSMDKLAVPLFWCTAKEAVKLRENRQRINSLWPSDTIWWHKYRSTLAQVMAWCLTAPSHYLNHCWLIISEVLRYSHEGNFAGNALI